MKVYCIFALCFLKSINGQFFYSFAPPVYHQPLVSYQPPVNQPLVRYQPLSHSVTYAQQVAPQQPQFRGYSYRTDLANGASSTVFYVNGAHDFRNIPQPTTTARSLASSIVDSQAVPNPLQKIENVLKLEDFEQLFKNARSGLVNFYAYPAGTAPLRNNANDSENVGAESVISSHFVVNQIDDMIEDSKNETTTVSSGSTSTSENGQDGPTSTSTSTSTTESLPVSLPVSETPTSSTSSTTTEDAESIVVEAKSAEASTGINAEIETTTIEPFRIVME